MTAVRSVGERLVPEPLKVHRTRRRILLAAGGLAVVLVAVAVWVLGFTGAFAVRSVQVSGLDRISRDRVLAAAGVPMGEPLARLDTGPIGRRVAALPGVDRVDVSRAWPNSVSIVITERHAAAQVARADGLWLVDRHGVAFQRLPRAVAGLPRLPPAALGTPAGGAALAVAAGLPDWLRVATTTVTAATPDSVTLGLTRGRTVVWGDDRHGAAKSAALRALLTRPGTHYDVSAPGDVTVR